MFMKNMKRCSCYLATCKSWVRPTENIINVEMRVQGMACFEFLERDAVLPLMLAGCFCFCPGGVEVCWAGCG